MDSEQKQPVINGNAAYNRESFLGIFDDIARKLSQIELRQFPDARLRTETSDAYICGGIAAMYWGVSSRTSLDLDMFMSRVVQIPPEVAAGYEDKNGESIAVMFDQTFRPEFTLLQEDYADRATRLAESETVRVFVLSPEDLILTKLSRFAERDRADIQELINENVVRDADFVYRLGMDAITTSYIGDPVSVTYALKEVCQRIELRHPKPRMESAPWDLR
jgi:hypothetical protein